MRRGRPEPGGGALDQWRTAARGTGAGRRRGVPAPGDSALEIHESPQFHRGIPGRALPYLMTDCHIYKWVLICRMVKWVIF